MKHIPQIVAHRGDSRNAPENTLAAFRSAIAAGADGVEFDVQLSSDGVPFVIHDYSLDRLAGRPDKVAELDSGQLALTDVGTWFNKRYPKRFRPQFVLERIPTLAQVLDLYSTTDGPVYIELKCENGDFRPLVETVCTMIRDSPLLPRIIVKSFRLGALALTRTLLPTVEAAALFEPSIMTVLRQKKHIIAMAREFGATQISLHRSLATPKLCRLARQARLPITVWTCDNPKWITRSLSRSIDTIITNAPAQLTRPVAQTRRQKS